MSPLLLLLLAILTASGAAELGPDIQLPPGEHPLAFGGARVATILARGGTYEVRKDVQSCGVREVIVISLARGGSWLEAWEPLCNSEGAQVRVVARTSGCNLSVIAYRGEERVEELAVRASMKASCSIGGERAYVRLQPLFWNSLLTATDAKWVSLHISDQEEELVIVYGTFLKGSEKPSEPKSPTPLAEEEKEEAGGHVVNYLKLIALLALLAAVAVLELGLNREGN